MRYATRLLGLAAVLSFAACDSGITDPFQEAAGTYELTVYAGRLVPATYNIQPGDPNYPEFPNGATFVVTDGQLQMNTNGTFIETNNYLITPNGGGSAVTRSFVSTGSWNVNGDQLFLSAPAQNNNGPRNVNGSLTFDTTNDVAIISYQEANGAGGFDAFEYQQQR